MSERDYTKTSRSSLENAYKEREKKYMDELKLRYQKSKEALRWTQLQQLQKEGKIKFLRRQAKYILIPLQTEYIDKKFITVEEECVYIADFAYDDANGKLHVEDVKNYEGEALEVFEIKRKLMRWIHKIVIEQV